MNDKYIIDKSNTHKDRRDVQLYTAVVFGLGKLHIIAQRGTAHVLKGGGVAARFILVTRSTYFTSIQNMK